MQNHRLWQPSATITTLQQRANLLKSIRQFFEHRGILEVDTPTMSHYGVTDQHLVSFTTGFNHPNKPATPLFLVTSPEYHMKRLLAAGSGPIYQINHCFRNEEMGRYHNPEFSLLEWYRPSFELFDLINEVDDLLKLFFQYDEIEMLSYQQAFQHYLNIDPLTVSDAVLQQKAHQHNFVETGTISCRDTLLQLLFGLLVEPQIGKEQPTVVYHFPASQAALAELSDEDPRVAKRFEIYFKGVELANGFKELTDANEQRHRFELDNVIRQQQQLPPIAMDQNFLAALESGLPKCSGVALGLDRLIMLILEKPHLREVLSFSVDIA